MTSESVARRYAKALFEIGEKEGSLVGLMSQVQKAADLWQENAELRKAMLNPQVSLASRREIWSDIISRLGIAKTVRNFLFLLVDKFRLSELPAIARELGMLTDEAQNRLRAEVTSAVPMSDASLQKLKSAIERVTGKVVLITKREDPSLIGGMVTRVGDTLYDGSIKRQLGELKENMLGRS
jgi:F-type H+-transporting ATPase subunit delta